MMSGDGNGQAVKIKKSLEARYDINMIFDLFGCKKKSLDNFKTIYR